jgi:hypothetical protein
MKIRSLIVAAIVLLALTSVLYWSEHRKPADETASADTSPAILKLDSAAITKIELKKKDAAPIVLTKTNSGAWQIIQPQAFNADQGAVTSLTSSLSSLNSDRIVDAKASNTAQYGFAFPAVEVDLTEKDNKTQKLLLGDTTPTGSDVYAMLAGDPRLFTIATYKKTSIDQSLNDLRDKRLLTVNADKISRVELLRNNQEIEFGRNKDNWQILKPKPLRADSVQVDELTRKLTDAKMELGLTDKDAEETAAAFAHATPVATAKVTDPSGTQELQVRKQKVKDTDTYYAKSSVVEGEYKIGSDLGQAVDKGLDDFRDKKLFDFGFNDPTKIEMHNGSKALFLSKNGSDWWWNGKKMEAGSVEDFISKLRDLTASKFVESGFANPTIEISVTSEDGKSIEKVSIAKSRDGHIAKRENDATLYSLDAAAVDGVTKAADEIKPVAAATK